MASNVFITDAHWRKTLAAVRGLGRQGIGVTVGEATRLATAGFSKYARHAAVYPSPLLNPDAFLDDIRKRLRRGSYSMLLPMEDETMDIISRHKRDLETTTYIPTVSHEKFHFARNKAEVIKAAEGLGIPVPRTWFIRDISEINRLKHDLPYPVVIKPRVGSGAAGISYPAGPEEFMERYMAAHERFPRPLVQEMIPRGGPGLGASFLMDANGQVKASFVHKRLREYPVSGGASTLRESVRHDGVLEMGRTLLASMGWSGVAMVEFKVDPRDGRPKLMEVNPRFWGSLALAILSGVNFPYLLYRLSKGENFHPVETYRTGVRCRWLLPGDLLHFIKNPERRHLLPDFLHFFGRNTAYDILSLEDPLPVLARVLTPLTFLYNRDMKERLRRRRSFITTGRDHEKYSHRRS